VLIFPEVWELERFQTASDLQGQGHPRSLLFVLFDRPHMASY